MRRWNGWGDDRVDMPVPEMAMATLRQALGELISCEDISRESLLARIEATRLSRHPLIDDSAETRLVHSRGQSLPDWISLRYGYQFTAPDGVAMPETEEDVREILGYAHRAGIPVIPYGGGTSVVGHINPLRSDMPVLTVSMARMCRMVELDETSRIATFEAGVSGPELEKQLQMRGYTLGHFPQSFEYSTLGGWIATRSSGQQSYYYGRIEQLYAGGELETPLGKLPLRHFPASAAGPDMREVVLGSEGRLGILTKASVRIRPLPEREGFYGVFFPTWQQGFQAVKNLAQGGAGVSMLRLSNPLETDITLLLSGKSWISSARRGLSWLGYGENRCLLIFGVTGKRAETRQAHREAIAECRKFGGLSVGEIVGKTWKKNRFRSPYLRNSLWELGVAVDTLETALPWSQVMEASEAIPQAIASALERYNERVLVFAHLSHVYGDGASVYVTFLFRRKQDPEETLEHWQAMKKSASETIQRLGGTISHQHGVGLDHAPYLMQEKGELGLKILRAVCQSVDPKGILNPGKLI